MCFSVPVQFATRKVMLLFCSLADGSLGVQVLLKTRVTFIPGTGSSGKIKHPIWVALFTLRLELKVSWEVKLSGNVKLQLLGITSTCTGGSEPGIGLQLFLSCSTVHVQKYVSSFHQCITSLQLAVQLKTTSLSSHTYTDCIRFKLVRSLTTQSPVNYRIMLAKL